MKLMTRARLGVVALFVGVAALRPTGAVPQGQAQTTPPPTGQAAPQTGTDPQTTFRARVDSVQVDVAVTDKQGQPVTDLTKADFDVRESNKPQTIETFKRHRH